MVGDLLEEYRQRPSYLWYWREVCVALRLAPLVRTLATSWLVLALCLWSVNCLAERWMQHPANLPEGFLHSAVRWGMWPVLLGIAHGAAGGVLGYAPRHLRWVAVGALLLSLLDWKLPIVGRLMYHILQSPADLQQNLANAVEFSAAIFGVWFGLRWSVGREASMAL